MININQNYALPEIHKKSNTAKRVHLTNIQDIRQWFDIQEKIGDGAAGTVYKVYDVTKKVYRALKMGKKTDEYGEKDHRAQFEQEIAILRMTDHPNIITLFGIYETRKRLCLVLEYCKENLYDCFTKRRFFPEDDVRQIITYLASALTYLHKHGIAHRDVKLRNILLTDNPNDPTDQWFLKLSDFGLAAIRKGPTFRSMFKSFCGTVQYMAPELTKKSYSQLCDIWSLGIIMYLLLSGDFPYKIEDIKSVHETIESSEISFKTFKISNSAQDLIKKCLEKNPALRISGAEILTHPFIDPDELDDDQKLSNILLLMDQCNKISSQMPPIRRSIIGNGEEASDVLSEVSIPESDEESARFNWL